MTEKTLSKGTLSLRFMQNAQRAKLQAQVELEQAKIKDDAEWSVSQEVRDAWGIGHSASASWITFASVGGSNDVVHEASYVPFIFQSDAGEASSSSYQEERPKLRGRRTFNARGEEVVQEVSLPVEDDQELAPDTLDNKPRSKFDKRPTSISGFRAPISTTKDGKKSRTKTAQMLIREDVSVRPPASMQPPPPPAKMEDGFVKPAGVDEPIRTTRRAPTDGRKRERDLDGGTDRAGSEGKKRKKKKDASA
ncbi:hypothetical protein BV20DRAFT_997194 [Pilatotrama ljubarskyi]|nr:hypothetical protein BV20DRAFT_997194 [Pilatotrama ljubarskyi]